MRMPPGEQGATKFAMRLRAELGKRHEIIPWDSPDRADLAIVRGGPCTSKLKWGRENSDKLLIQYGGSDFVSDHSRAMLRGALECADGVVYNSRFGRGEVHRYIGSIDYPKETVIPNGAPRGPISKLGKPVCILACDNYDLPSKHRALGVALEAMPLIRRSYPDAELRILGSKPPIPESLPFKATCLGHIKDDRELNLARAEGSVLLHLVERDNCPNTVVEALGQGVPVVCHKDSGVPEFAGFFGMASDHRDPEDVARKAVSLLSLGGQWQERWLKEFDDTLSIEVIAKRYEKFVEAL